MKSAVITAVCLLLGVFSASADLSLVDVDGTAFELSGTFTTLMGIDGALLQSSRWDSITTSGTGLVGVLPAPQTNADVYWRATGLSIPVGTARYVKVYYRVNGAGFTGDNHRIFLETSDQGFGGVNIAQDHLIAGSAGSHSFILDLQSDTTAYTGNWMQFRWDMWNDPGQDGKSITINKVVFGASIQPVTASGHPRLFFSNDDIPALKKKVQSGWLQGAFTEMVANANDYMTVPVNPYPMSGPGTNGDATAGRALNERVNTLALTGILLDDLSYIDHAIAICMAAVAQTDVNDFYGYNGHLAIADGLHAYAVAYDWLYNYMTAPERTALYDEIMQFMNWVYDNSVNDRDYEPTPMSSNHNSVHHSALGLAALATATNATVQLERAAAYVEGYYRYARDATGYNSEGIGYYGYGSLGAVPFSLAYERAGYGSLIDEYQKNKEVPEFVLRYIQPWGSRVIAFNDSNDRLDIGSGMMEFVSRYQDRVGLWAWMKMYGPDGDGTYSGSDDSYIGMGCTLPYTILFADETLQPQSPADAGLPLGKFFDRGSGSFRSSWQDDAALATFTCGVDMHRGHNHRDEGSFTFSAFGEYFALDPGYKPDQSRAHNLVLVNGVGQDREPTEYDTYGLTLATKDFGDAWYMKGDATEAYRDFLNLDHAFRQFMFVKAPQPYIIVSDDIEDAAGSATNLFSWLLHTAKGNHITVGPLPGEFYIQGSGRAVCFVRFLNPTSGLAIQEADLTGDTFVLDGITLNYSDYFKEVTAEYTGQNPKYTAILIAAESLADLPEVGTSSSVDGLRVNVHFPGIGAEDQILISDESMDFQRLENVFYLHADMPPGSAPGDTSLWYDDPTIGSNLNMLGGSTTSNCFDLNGYVLRAPDTALPASFDGTFVIGHGEGSECRLYAADWRVAGMDVDDVFFMSLHRPVVDLSIADLLLRAGGKLTLSTTSGGNHSVNLAMDQMSGSGTLAFGSISVANDTNGIWRTTAVNRAHEFSGTLKLTRGELIFDAGSAFSNATLSIDAGETNRVVLETAVSFAAVEFGTSRLVAGQYTAEQVNNALGTDRFSGGGSLTVPARPEVFYLQETMAANDSILDRKYWFDARTAGNAMPGGEPFSGNRFVINRQAWRAPNTSGSAVFDGKIVVDNAGSGLLLQYCGNLLLNGGMELDSHLVVRPHRPVVSLSVSDVKLGSSGELIFRTLASGNNTQNLSVGNLSGNGRIQFGTGYPNDTNGVWSLSVTDPASNFSGTVQLLTGALSFGNPLSLPQAMLKVEPAWDNHVVLANDVEFSRLRMGVVTLVSGTYTAAELNTVLGTDRFSGPGTLSVNYMQNNFSGWVAEFNLTGNDALPLADLEPDGMNNLLEYALGGDPTNDDSSAVMPSASIVNASNTNWLEYVYRRRLDAEARGLKYELLACTNLVEGFWFNIGPAVESGSGSLNESVESVTNQIPTEIPAQFIKLQVSGE